MDYCDRLQLLKQGKFAGRRGNGDSAWAVYKMRVSIDRCIHHTLHLDGVVLYKKEHM